MKSSPQKSLTLSWGSCFHTTNVSWNRAGDFRPERSSSPFSPLPQLSRSLLPFPQAQTSPSGTLTCGNEPALQCTTSRYCCRERGGKGQHLTRGKWMYISAWKDEEDWNFWNDFCSAVLLIHLIFLTPVQSSARCRFSWDIKTLDFQIFLGSSSSSFCMCSHEAANTTQRRSREEIYSGMWRKCSWFWQKNTLPFKLLCSTFVVSDCFLSSGCTEREAVLPNICQSNETWMLEREPSAPTSHSTAYFPWYRENL